jgi:hypothetical protein
VDLAELNACLAERIQSITEELIGSDPTSKHGHTVRFRTKGSLAVVVSGKDRGAFFDHEAKVRGGPLELVRLLRNEPINLTIQWARAKVGAAVPAIIPARREISVEKQRSPSATLPLARQY